jgi:NitT/TauT family transport system substrate-binding protein
LPLALALTASPRCRPQDKVTLQLKWVTQAQFAGYYVAKAKGFYKEAGLDVTIKPGGPDIAPEQVLAGGGADVIVDWMPSALARRAREGRAAGQHRAALQALRHDADLPQGHRHQATVPTSRARRWASGSSATNIRSWPGCPSLGYKTDGSAGGVKVIKQGFNVDPILQKQADCVSTMTYNEYWQVIDAGIKADDLVTFKYADQGVATLEDGLYVWKTS